MTKIMTRFLLIAMTLIAVSGTVQAQRMTPQPEPLMIDGMVVSGSLDDLTLSLTGTQSDGCDLPLSVDQSLSEGLIWLEITPEAAELQGRCSPTPVPFELEITLDSALALNEQSTLQIIVNNSAATLAPRSDSELGIPGGDVSNTFRAEIDGETDFTLTPAVRENVRVQNITMSPGSETNTLDLAIEGEHLSGCPGETYAHVQAKDGLIDVKIFRVTSFLLTCPAVLQYYEGTVAIADDYSGLYLIQVNNASVFYNFDEAQTLTPDDIGRVPHLIESVEAVVLESFPPQVDLLVRGIQTDGCEFPVQVEQTRGTGTITIEIFREVPDTVACTEIITEYEERISLGALQPGNYTIEVNDFTLELDL